uniref:Cry9Ea protein n=1 Tax=Fopius arisanus TaxID=64838 RepID=A0A0C9RZY9_9HYME
MEHLVFVLFTPTVQYSTRVVDTRSFFLFSFFFHPWVHECQPFDRIKCRFKIVTRSIELVSVYLPPCLKKSQQKGTNTFASSSVIFYHRVYSKVIENLGRTTRPSALSSSRWITQLAFSSLLQTHSRLLHETDVTPQLDAQSTLQQTKIIFQELQVVPIPLALSNSSLYLFPSSCISYQRNTESFYNFSGGKLLILYQFPSKMDEINSSCKLLLDC